MIKEFGEYQDMAARTINTALPPSDVLLHALHGMASEIGEIHGIYQKRYQGHDVDAEHLMKEVGDLLWFISEFCSVNGWFMADVATMNIEKLKARYPDGFAAEKSLNRKEGDV